MGRESIWTPEEDALLLRTAGQSSVEVNRQLMESGFEHRTPDQIKHRRNYLRKAVVAPAANTPEAELFAALQRRRELTSLSENIPQEIKELTRRIHELLRLLGREIGEA